MRENFTRWMLFSALLAQALTILTALCIPFGFDHPSAWGLDFGHFLALLVVHAVVLLVGIFAAIVLRWFALAALQLAVTAGIVALSLSGILGM